MSPGNMRMSDGRGGEGEGPVGGLTKVCNVRTRGASDFFWLQIEQSIEKEILKNVC